MMFKVFISSVQSEFAKERQALAQYIREDAMLGDFFAHDSIPRNRLIAQAMSWTSYVEKSGSVTGSIVDKCVAQGLARPDFEPTVGFFRTVVWRSGTLSAPSRDPVVGLSHGTQLNGPKSGAESKGPSQRGRVKRPSQGAESRHKTRFEIVISTLACNGDAMSASQIAKSLGMNTVTGRLKKTFWTLLEDRIIERTEKKINSRLQKYRLTSKGRALAAEKVKTTV